MVTCGFWPRPGPVDPPPGAGSPRAADSVVLLPEEEAARRPSGRCCGANASASPVAVAPVKALESPEQYKRTDALGRRMHHP